MALLWGFQATAYYSTDTIDKRPGGTGTHDFQTILTGNDWLELEVITTVTLNASGNDVDITTRSEAKSGWSATARPLKQGNVTCSMRWDPARVDMARMIDRWIKNRVQSLLFLDQPVTVDGAQGLVGNFNVSFDKNEPLDNAQSADLTLGIVSYPDWVVASSTGTVLTRVDPSAP